MAILGETGIQGYALEGHQTIPDSRSPIHDGFKLSGSCDNWLDKSQWLPPKRLNVETSKALNRGFLNHHN